MADIPSLSSTSERDLLLLVAKAMLVILGVLALASAVYLMFHIFILLFIALVLAAAMRPAVLAARRRGVPKALSVLLIYILFIAALIGAALLVRPILVTQIGALIASGPQWYAQFYASVRNSSNGLLQQVAGSLPDPTSLTGGQVPTSTDAAGLAGNVLAQAIGLGSSAVTFVVEAISTLVLALYWTIEQPRFERLWLSVLPAANRARYLTIWREIEAKMGAYVRGIGIQCLSIGLMVGIGYWILGIQYFLALAVVAAFCEAIPLVGPFVAAIPALLVASSQGGDKIILVLVFTLIVQEIESQVLVPKVMERAVGVSPLVTLLAILGFGSVLGLLGIVLAIPFAAVLQVLLDSFVLNKEVELDAEAQDAPLGSLQAEVRRLQLRLRTRYRSNTEFLEPHAGDNLDSQLEKIAAHMDSVVAQAADAVNPNTPPVSTESVQQLSQELQRVQPLLEEARSQMAATASHQSSEHSEQSAETQHLVDSMDNVMEGAAQAVVQAASMANESQAFASTLSND